MYLGLDGTGVPVRPAAVEDRAGKQPDGSAKTREVKLATVWTAEGRDKAGRRVRDLGSVSYKAAVESAASRDTDPQPAPSHNGSIARQYARFRHGSAARRHRRRRRRVDLICCVRRYVAWDRKTPVKSGPDLDLRNITDRPHRFRRKAMTPASRFHGGAPCGSA